MFSPANARAMSAYRQVGVQTMVDSASPQQLIKMLFDGLLASIHAAKGAMERRDIGEKVRHIGKAIRILQEGLLGALDREKGGELASNLASLYEYCTAQLTLANARNDVAMVDEVAGLVTTVAQGWNAIPHAPATAGA